MKLSPTQLRVLRYASEGRLVRWDGLDGDWTYAIELEATVNRRTAETLEDADLIVWEEDTGDAERAAVTPKGAALLNSRPEPSRSPGPLQTPLRPC